MNKITLVQQVLGLGLCIKDEYKVVINHQHWTHQLKINRIMHTFHTSIISHKIMFSHKLY